MYLKSLLGQISFPLYLDVKSVRYVRNHNIYQFANAKYKMFKYYDKSKFEGEDVPMNRSKISFFISKTLVVAIRLEHKHH